MRKAFLCEAERIFRARQANFFLANTSLRGIDTTNVVSYGIHQRYVEQFVQYYYRYDPWWSALRSRKIVCKSGDAFPYPCPMNSEYYEDFLKPQNIHYSLVVFLRSGAKLLGVIGLFRPVEEPNFSEADALKANILAPHLVNALRNITLLSQIEQDRNLLRRANGVPLSGALLLDYEFRPLYWNFKARDICLALAQERLVEGASGVEGNDFPIPSEVLKDCLALKRLTEGMNQIAPLGRKRIIRTGKSNRFWVESSLTPNQAFQGASSPCFLVSLQSISENYAVREEVIREKYHVTRREMEIIRCVSEGLTNRDIGEKLFISQLTVKKHLEKIFEKTGVKNRTELTSRLEFL